MKNIIERNCGVVADKTTGKFKVMTEGKCDFIETSED